MYETTNVIDIYIQNKPTVILGKEELQLLVSKMTQVPKVMCRLVEIVLTVLGLRKRGVEIYPVGESIIEFEWLDLNGDVISTEPDFEVLPTKQLPILQRSHIQLVPEIQ